MGVCLAANSMVAGGLFDRLDHGEPSTSMRYAYKRRSFLSHREHLEPAECALATVRCAEHDSTNATSSLQRSGPSSLLEARAALPLLPLLP